MNTSLLERLQVVSGFVPVAMNTNPGPSSDWVSMKNYKRLLILFFKNAGTAGDDPTLTVLQAKTVSGGSSKALAFTRIDVKQGVQTGISQFTKITQAAANTYSEATSAEAQAIWAVEFKAEDLDIANDFDCVQASIGDVGTNAQLGCLLYLLADPVERTQPLADAIGN